MSDVDLTDTAAIAPEHGGGEASPLSQIIGNAYDEAARDANDQPPADEATSAAPDTTDAPPPGAQDDPKGDPQTKTDLEPIEAPAHWPAADREMFAKVGAEGQHWLLNRHRAMEGAFTKNSQAIAPMRDLVTRWDPYFQQLGVPAAVAIDRLLSTENKLRTGSNEQKIQILRELVHDYGIQGPEDDPGAGAGGGDGGTPPMHDPRLDGVIQAVSQMQASQQQQSQQAIQQQQAAQQAGVARATAELRAFIEEKGDDGKLSHPYYGEVQNDMTRMAQADLQSGIQPDLASLYERACWANPTVRAKMMAADNQEKVEKARRANGQISGAGATPAEQPKGLREALEAGYDRLSAA